MNVYLSRGFFLNRPVLDKDEDSNFQKNYVDGTDLNINEEFSTEKFDIK